MSRKPKRKKPAPADAQATRGLTLDTGIMIALADNDARAHKIIDEARENYRIITVPAPVIAEWWPGPTGSHPQILKLVSLVEPTTEEIAKAAGRARAAASVDADSKRKISGIDAIVMASANRRGDIVFTDDGTDLQRLTPHFPKVEVRSLKQIKP